MDAPHRPLATFLREFALPIAIVMLVLWAIATWFEAPGIVHLFFTLGIFLLLYAIVVRGDRQQR